MRICIDAREVREVTTGIGRYSMNLVQQIARLDRRNEYIVIRRTSYPRPIVVQENFREILVPYGIANVRNTFLGASVINPLKADVYHALTHFLPLGVKARRVIITLHDLMWVTHAHLAFESRGLAQWRRWTAGPMIGHAVCASDHVVAVSESTRQAAIEHYHLPGPKFTVVHHGVDPVFRSAPDVGLLPEACQGRRFIFALGNTRPYKNIPRLLKAFGLVAPGYPDLALVVCGRGDGYPTFLALSRELGIADRVILTGQLSDREVGACFSNCVFFAFPSLIEGFGLPALEAMSAGCPVLASNVFSLPEILGDSAVLVDPTRVDAIAAGMRRLLDDERFRHGLAAKGRQQAARFTWETCAERTMGLYGTLAGGAAARRSVSSPLHGTVR